MDASPAATAHSERLWPGAGSWGVLALLAVTVTVAFIPVGRGAAVVAAIVSTGAALWAAVALATPVTVAGGELRTGRAHIATSMLGDVEVLDAAGTRLALGREHDPRAFLCQRGWVRTAVRARVLDAADPTPYWLVSTRHPDRLAAALRTTAAPSPSAQPDAASEERPTHEEGPAA